MIGFQKVRYSVPCFQMNCTDLNDMMVYQNFTCCPILWAVMLSVCTYRNVTKYWYPRIANSYMSIWMINIGTKVCGCLFDYHAVVIICWVLRIVFENHTCRYNSDNTDAARRVILPIKYVALHYVSASLVSQIHHQVECCAFMLFCMKKPQCQPFTIEQKGISFT